MSLKLLLFPLLPLLFFSSCGYNEIQSLDEDVKANWSEVENQYQRRFDLIPNLLETVKGYAKHEKDTLTAVVQARAQATQTKLNVESLSDSKAFQQFQKAQDTLGQTLSRLMVVVEKYPDLKANSNFQDLSAQLEGTENRIAVARKRYIETVAEFNKKLRFFPSNITNNLLLHLKPRESFAISPESKQAPKVKFE